MCELKTVTEYDVCHSHSKNALANDWQLLQGIGSGPGRSSGHSPGKKPVSEPFNPTLPVAGRRACLNVWVKEQ